MTHERFEALYERFCDGTLTPAELEEFKSALHDSGMAKAFVDYSLFEAVINDELRLTEEKPAAEERARRGSVRLVAPIQPTQPKPHASKSHGAWRLPALAATLTLACLLAFWAYGRRGAVEFARLEDVRNTTLQRGGQTIPAAIGAVSDGDTLNVAADGAAQLVYPDGTTLDLFGGTVLTVTTNVGAKIIRLDAGALSAIVTRQPPEKPARFLTPQSSTTVVGTRLKVSAMEQATRVSVAEGEVQVRRSEGGEEARVSAGTYVVANKGIALETKTLPQAGRMLEDFESGQLKDWLAFPALSKTSPAFIQLTDGHGGGRAMELKYGEVGRSWYQFFSATQDWSGYDGIRLYWRGGQSKLAIDFEIIENSTPQPEAKNRYEYFVCSVNNDFEGWRQVTLRFENFSRRQWQQPSAPNDGMTLHAVRGFSILIPIGRGTFAVDGIELFRE